MALVPVPDDGAGSQTSSSTSVRPPRPPVNFQDLLRYSVEVGGGAGPSEASQLDDEKREFLENVFKSITVDVIKELCEALDVLKDIQSGQKSESEYEEALEKISDFIDNIDFANDFCKIGGFQVLQACLDSGHSGVRWRAAGIVGECSQNNPFCQRAALDLGFLPTLLEMSEKDVDETCRVKAIFAVSCIVRDFLPAFEVFSNLDGFSVLLRLMSTTIGKLKLKATFFLSSLLSTYPTIKGTLSEMGFVEDLVGLSKEGGDLREHVLSCLALLIDGCPQALSAASQPSLQLRSFLHQLIEEGKGQESQNEELEYAKRILALVYEVDSDGETN